MAQPTPLGTATVSSIVRQFILPKITDAIYDSNVLFFRINQAKRFIRGGTQIEAPIMYSKFQNGGSYRGFQQLNMAPNDTVRTAAWEWKQYYVPVSVDGRTLLHTDSPEAIADYVKLQMVQAEMEMADNLGTDLYGTTCGGDGIDGLGAAIDSADPAGANYGGLDRDTYTWWRGGEDATSTTLTIPVLNEAFMAASSGGRHPSLMVSRKDQYNRYYNIAVADQTVMQGPVMYDEQLYSAGFTNLVFNGCPWVVDPKCTLGTGSNSCIYMLNEDYLQWAVSPRADMRIEDFQTPIDQDAMATKMLFAGNLLCTAPGLQHKLSAIAA